MNRLNEVSKKVVNFVCSKWFISLAVLAIFGWLVNSYMFYPGYMSPDSLSQLCQAMHQCILNDWHPISMTLMWRFLISITGGYVASMLLVQVAMLWSALLLISLYIWRTTGSRKLSLLPLMIGLLPNVVNISGVIWKDDQMAFAFLLSVALALFATTVKHKLARTVLFAMSFFVLVYGATVRTNGFVAVVPIAFFVINRSCWIKKFGYQLITSFAIAIFALTLMASLNAIFHAQKGNTLGVMMSADVVNTLPPAELQQRGISIELKQALLRLSKCSHFGQRLVFNNWHCSYAQDKYTFTQRQYDELKSLWLKATLHNPGAYTGYKLEAYSGFLFSDDSQSAVWKNGIDEVDSTGTKINKLNLEAKSVSSMAINRNYTLNFGYKYFPFVYKAWFWLAVGVSLLFYSRRLRQYRMVVVVLALSAILNILSFAPVSLPPDYRYIYWSVIASTLAVLLTVLELRYNAGIPKALSKQAEK